MNNKNVIQLNQVSKFYHRGSETVHAVDEVSITITAGEYCSIVGPSGSGKTTLMNLIGCLDRPTTGSIAICGTQVHTESEKVLTRMRQKSIGFVFQHFFLVPTLTVLDNVQLPVLFAGTHNENRAEMLLDRVDLKHRLHHFPGELSGGEMQRVAIARSLVNAPPILLADEPTGNLDTHNAESIIALFEQLNHEGITIIMVTHNPDLAKRCDRMIQIEDGKVQH